MQRRKRILWPGGSSRLSNYLARKKEEVEAKTYVIDPAFFGFFRLTVRVVDFLPFSFPLLFFSSPPFVPVSFFFFSLRPPKPKPEAFSPKKARIVPRCSFGLCNLRSNRFATVVTLVVRRLTGRHVVKKKRCPFTQKQRGKTATLNGTRANIQGASEKEGPRTNFQEGPRNGETSICLSSSKRHW